MKTTKVSVLLVVLIIGLLVMSGCSTNKITLVDSQATSQAYAQAAVNDYAAEQAKLPTPTARVVEVIKTVEVLVTPIAAPIPTEAPITWTQIQVGRYSEGVQADGLTWELVKGTWFAATTKNGSYEAVPSAKVGVVNGQDYGWCKPNQLDCPPHAYLIRVEVPEQFASCVKVPMDISLRMMAENNCNEPVPMRITLRDNNITRSASEQQADYLALAGLKQQPLDTLSEVGLFVSVGENGQNELTYEGKKVAFGYSCWNCLPDTKGPNDPIPYPLVDIETFGTQGAGPTGSALLPGVVFSLPRPTVDPYTLTFEVKVIDQSVFWIGRYDVPLLVAPTMPTATP